MRLVPKGVTVIPVSIWSCRSDSDREDRIGSDGAAADAGQHVKAAPDPFHVESPASAKGLAEWSSAWLLARSAVIRLVQVEEEGPIRADKRRRFLEAQERGEAPKL